MYNFIELVSKYVAAAEQKIKSTKLGTTSSALASSYADSDSPAAYAFAAAHIYMLLVSEIVWVYFANKLAEKEDIEDQEAE